MTKKTLTELLRIAYRYGRDNGEGMSEKNFNDLLQVEAINQALHQPPVGISSLEKIILEYKDDLDSPMWKLDVYANGKYIGYLRRGDRYGFWFESKLGIAILKKTIEELKVSISEELERYRIFFKQ